jgi:hypothetical protein
LYEVNLTNRNGVLNYNMLIKPIKSELARLYKTFLLELYEPTQLTQKSLAYPH